MTGTALARVGQPAEQLTLDETMRLADVLAQSGFFEDARGMAQAVTKMLAGRELGFGPVASLTNVNIIKGKVTMSAKLMAAAIKRSGRYTYRVREHTDTSCAIDYYEGDEKIGESVFSMDDARKAGLGGNMYAKFPRNMLWARAMSNGANWHTPDVFGGPVFTPEELGAEVDEDGEVVEVIEGKTMPEVIPQPQPEQAPASPAAPTAPVPAAPASPNPVHTPAPAPAPEPDEQLPPAAENGSHAIPQFDGDDRDSVSPSEAKFIGDYLRVLGAGRQFVHWALIDAGVQHVSDPHEALGRLTKAQAKALIASAAARYAPTPVAA